MGRVDNTYSFVFCRARLKELESKRGLDIKKYCVKMRYSISRKNPLWEFWHLNLKWKVLKLTDMHSLFGDNQSKTGSLFKYKRDSVRI